MIDRFMECLEYTLQFEGGYVNHPADRGGATNKGITQANYDRWRIMRGLGRQPVVGISAAEVQEIYRDEYWKKADCDHFPAPVDLVVFDAAVNSGPGRSIKWVQRLVGAKQDGVFGPKTFAAISQYIAEHGARNMARDLVAIREGFIDELVDRDPSQVVFQKGWNRRLSSLRTAVSEVA